MAAEKKGGILVGPFCGLKPPQSLMCDVASPPYDVLDSAEARVMIKDNAKSFLRVNKPEIDFDEKEKISVYDDRVYAKGKENLHMFVDNGWLVRDKKPSMYVYSQTMDGLTQYGLVCEVSAAQYEDDLIKKHELTRAKKENDRTKMMDTQSAHVGPVFLTYRENSSISALIASKTRDDKSYSTFTADDGVIHSLWVIDDDSLITKLSTLFKEQVPALYVADGHHRTASAWRVWKERGRKSDDTSMFLSVLFPSNQLRILDYNRIVKGLNGLTNDEFLTKLSELKWTYRLIDEDKEGQVTKSAKKGEYRMYLSEKGWYVLTAPPTDDSGDAGEEKADKGSVADGLDVSILTEKLLGPILDIRDLRKDERIGFAGGSRGLSWLKKKVDEFVENGDCGVAFGLYPTSLDDLMNIADANEIMPPKSTWFEPKLRSGVIVRTFGDAWKDK